MDKKIDVDWMDYINMCKNLSYKISSAKLSVTSITGPPRGGVIPAIIISHALDLEYIEWGKFTNTFCNLESTKDVLVVDDITCTGRTLMHFPIHTKAVIYKRITSTVIPQIFLIEVPENVWIKFPYEK